MKIKDILGEAVLGAYVPGKTAEIKDTEHGTTTTLDLTKPENASALRPNDQGQLEYDPTPDTTTPGAQPTAQLAPGAEVAIKTDEEMGDFEDDSPRTSMIRRLADTMGWDISDLELLSDKEISALCDRHCADEDIGGKMDATDSYIDSVIDHDFEDKVKGPNRQASMGNDDAIKLEAMLRIAGLR